MWRVRRRERPRPFRTRPRNIKSQLPDRLFAPGTLDLAGNAHHILHVTSAVACYFGAMASQHVPAYEASVWRAGGVAGPRGWR